MRLNGGKMTVNGQEIGEIAEMQLEAEDDSSFMEFKGGFSGQGTLHGVEISNVFGDFLQVITTYGKREKHRKRVENRTRLYKKRKALGRIK